LLEEWWIEMEEVAPDVLLARIKQKYSEIVNIVGNYIQRQEDFETKNAAAGPITANVGAGSATSEGLESKVRYGRVEEEDVEPTMKHW